MPREPFRFGRGPDARVGPAGAAGRLGHRAGPGGRLEGGSDFACGTRDGNIAEAIEREDSGACVAGQSWDAREKREKSDVAEGDSMARGRQRFERDVFYA